MATVRCAEVEFRNIEGILFDKDGTLAKVEDFLRQVGHRRSRLIDAQVPGVQEPLLMALGLEGEGINPVGLLAVASRLETEIAAAAYVAETGRSWSASREIVRAAFEEADQSCQPKAKATPPCPGVIELLANLRAAGLKLGIISSDTPDQVDDFVRTYNLTATFDLWLGTTGGVIKPQSAFLEQACSALALDPQKALVIGDADVDMALAHNGRARGCIGVTWGWSHPVPLSGADGIAHHCTDIELVDP